MRVSDAGRRVLLAMTGAALVSCLVACTPVGARDQDLADPPAVEMTPSPAPTVSASAPAPAPVVQVPTTSAALPGPQTVVAPQRLSIPDLGVDMPVVDVGVEDNGQMELPEDPAVAGWYRYGPGANHAAGNQMVAAHVDAVGYPIGPLAQLRDVGVGADVVVTGSDGSARTYRIESLTYYEKATLPVADLFARDGAPGLVIITCGGPFNSETGSYRDNVVAVARPV